MGKHIEITENMRILFQGDSITDAGRGASPSGLGNGYAHITSSLMGALYPGCRLEFVNRGISGNRAKDLGARWQRDCIDIKPDLVSVMIGVNDTWRRYDSNDPTPVEKFEAEYRAFLERTRDELSARIVIIEPFLLPCPEDRVKWREDLDPKIDAARRLAREFADVLVPMDGIMNAAALEAVPEYWAGDGVHPTPAGHGLIALSWVRCVTGKLQD
jgi:lysophospholipase L1-like esterase